MGGASQLHSLLEALFCLRKFPLLSQHPSQIGDGNKSRNAVFLTIWLLPESQGLANIGFGLHNIPWYNWHKSQRAEQCGDEMGIREFARLHKRLQEVALSPCILTTLRHHGPSPGQHPEKGCGIPLLSRQKRSLLQQHFCMLIVPLIAL